MNKTGIFTIVMLVILAIATSPWIALLVLGGIVYGQVWAVATTHPYGVRR